MHISSVRVLRCCAAVTSKSQSASPIVRFYPLKRKDLSSRHRRITEVRLHIQRDGSLSFNTLQPAGKRPPFSSSSRIITVSVAGDLSAVIEGDTLVWLTDLCYRNTNRVLGVYSKCGPWSVAVRSGLPHFVYYITLHAVREWHKC